MEDRFHSVQDPSPLRKRIVALFWRERRALAWTAVASVLAGLATVLLLQRYILTTLVALVAGLAHGCGAALDNLRELH